MAPLRFMSFFRFPARVQCGSQRETTVVEAGGLFPVLAKWPSRAAVEPTAHVERLAIRLFSCQKNGGGKIEDRNRMHS
jgi:hypothetical protein